LYEIAIGGCQFGYLGSRKFKCNVVPLYMAQMVYVEVALGVEMDWSNIPTSSRSQRKLNLHHRILWLIKTWPNPLYVNIPFRVFGSKWSLVVPTPINLSFDAHDNEIYINRDFPHMFENVQTNQDVDPNSLQDVITNVIERWSSDWR
jgi:hypothetical protein